MKRRLYTGPEQSSQCIALRAGEGKGSMDGSIKLGL